MVDILLSGTQSLRVNDEHIDDLVLLIFKNQRLSPHPNALGLRVHGRPHCEASFTIEEHLVEEIGLASSINSCDRDDGQFALNGEEQFQSLRVDGVL